MNKLRSVTQVGTIPPPIGGVSVHIFRLIQALRERQIDTTLLDLHWQLGKAYSSTIRCATRKERMLALLAYWKKVLFSRELIHCHASRLKSFAVLNSVLCFAWRRSKVVVTFHTGERFPTPGSIPYRVLIYLLRRVDAVICVSQELHWSISDAMSRNKGRCRLIVRISPYISGPAKTSAIGPSANHNGGTRIVVAGSGKRIYNWEFVCTLIDLMPPEIEWVCCVYGGREKDYWPEMERELSRHENVIFHDDLSSEQFAAVLRSATVYFRPTETDGDSITIHEAQAADVACVVSDVVMRPDGVLCYAHNNVSDCREKLMQAVGFAQSADLADHAGKDCDLSADTSAAQIIDVYKRVVA
jgi:glycosyltransferase involved in cell wall biosynthesis